MNIKGYMKSVAAAVAIFAVAGCATATNQNIPFERAANAPAGSANLYIYRRHAPPYIYRAEVHINGQLVGRIPEGGYAVYPVPLGENDIVLRSFDWPDVSFKLPVEDSSDLFVRFSGDAFTTPGGDYDALYTVHSVAQVHLVAPHAAEAEISGCCRLVRP